MADEPEFERMKYIGISVILFFLSSCASVFQSAEKDHVRSLADANRYFEQINRPQFSESDYTEEEWIEIIDIFTTMVNHPMTETADVNKFRYGRGVALMNLNYERLSGDASVNYEEANAAISDFDFVKQAVGDAMQPDTDYFSGLIAYNLLNDPALAGTYWKKCAARNHAGCVNNVAFGHFTGQFGLEIDLQKAIDLNTEVVATGTDFQCAGTFSARLLAEMHTFLPLNRYEKSWLEWLNEAYELQAQVAELVDEPHACYFSELNTTAFLIRSAHGVEAKEPLGASISVFPKPTDEYNMALIYYFLGLGSRQDVYAALPEDDDVTMCSVRYSLLLFDKISGTLNNDSDDFSAITLGDEVDCAMERAWIKYLGLSDQSGFGK